MQRPIFKRKPGGRIRSEGYENATLSKGTTGQFQKGPPEMERGQYPVQKKNILPTRTNRVQWLSSVGEKTRGVSTASSACRVAGLSNPDHKEHKHMSAALRLVEGSSMDKQKALDAALSQIERISARARSCGSARAASTRHRGHPHRLARPRHRARHRRLSARPHRRDLRPGIARARPRSPCTVVAEAQKRGGICAFIDAEHALDPPTRASSA